jgi:ribose/xylose/arabinose/galactoside ABC-type transport system permease subunit
VVVTDEASAMLRVAAFGFVCSFVYGFLTYEFFGTWSLITLSLGPGFAGLIMWFESRKYQTTSESFRDTAWRFAGLPRMDPDLDHDLRADDMMVIPSASMWPFILSLGLGITLTGLVFGAWLLLLGGVFTIWGIWGWVAAASRETHAVNRAASRKPRAPARH